MLVSAIVCLVSAEKIPLKQRIFKCKPIPFKKHHSIFESIIPSIVVSSVDSADVPGEYNNVPAEVTTLGTDPVVPAEPQQEEQNPPPLQEVQYPPQPEVQYPVSQQEVQPAVAPQQEVVQNPPEQRPLYPPQHEGQQHYTEQNPQFSNNNGPYYLPQTEGMYYPPPNYQSFTTNNVPYNYPVYGQNMLRSVQSLDGGLQTYPPQQRPHRVNLLIRKPVQYYSNNAPPLYDQYTVPQYNYVSQAPRTAQAITGGKAKSA